MTADSVRTLARSPPTDMPNASLWRYPVKQCPMSLCPRAFSQPTPGRPEYLEGFTSQCSPRQRQVFPLTIGKKLKNKVCTTTFHLAYRTTLKHLHYIPDNLWVWLLMFPVLAAFSSLSHFPTPLPVFPGTTSQIKDFIWILVCWRIPK